MYMWYCRKVAIYMMQKIFHNISPEAILTLVAEGDHRGAVAGGQAFVKTAPVSLVLISDLSRFGDAKSARSQLMGAMDSGIVSQNISIFCSAANIATVPRASMDNEQLKKVLKLKDSQMPMMNHPVGYFK